MNATIQTILVVLTVILAVGFLIRKFIWKPKAKNSKGCGSGDCGCD